MKNDIERFVALSPSNRLRLIFSKWWLVLVGIIGLIAALMTFFLGANKLVVQAPEKIKEFRQIQQMDNLSHIPNLIGQAHAAEDDIDSSDHERAVLRQLLKDVIIGGCFVIVSVLFLWCLLALSFSTKAATVGFAVESLKTLVGFFIGALTGFLGT